MARMDAQTRYLTALHKVQAGIGLGLETGLIARDEKHVLTGVASARINHETIVALLRAKGLLHTDETEVKTRRLGIDSLMVEQAALTMLLVEKGIITDAEYMDMLVEMTEREARAHEECLSRHFGRAVSLV